MRNRLIFLCLLLLAPSYSTSGLAATITAGSPLAGDVQVAINQAADGDTVIVPAGSATWTTGLTIANKSIILTGAGIDQTIITDNISSSTTPALTVNLRIQDHLTLSGFTWKITSGGSFGIVAIGNASGVGANNTARFRVTNCKFISNPSGGSRGLFIGGAHGLIDHCHFITLSASGGQMVTVSTDSGASNIIAWHTPQSWGDTNCVCMEDNFFDAFAPNDGAFDTYTGQRVTFRHNVVQNTTIGGHGYDSSIRSARSYEIYQNQFVSTDGKTDHLGILIRGGSALIWGNTFDAGYGNSQVLAFNLYASDHVFKRPTAYAPSAAWGSTVSGVGPVAVAGATATGSNAVDGNFVGPGHADQGYPLLDQPGRGSFPSTNTGNWPTVTTGYALGDYEALDPIYQWNNNVNGNTSPTCGFNGAAAANYIKAGRDYYDNVPKPGYKPLQYPHPLAQTSSVGPPEAPKNLRVVPGK